MAILTEDLEDDSAAISTDLEDDSGKVLDPDVESEKEHPAYVP